MAELLSGPVALYHDRRYEKEQLEAALNEQLEALRQRYPKQSMKNLEGHFQDLLKLVSHTEGKKRNELQQVLTRDCGVQSSSLGQVLEALDAVVQSTSG
jgi:membrane peptidoglycan carboxypeptidase